MLLIKWSSASVTTCLKAEFLPVCWSGAFRSFTQCQQRNTSTVMKLNWRGLVLMDSTASGKNQTQHIRTKRRSRGDGLDWFGIGPGHPAVTVSTMNYSVYQSQMWGYMSISWRSCKTGSCNRSMIPSTATKLQQNGWERKDLRELAHQMNWSNIPPPHVRDCERLIKSHKKLLTSSSWRLALQADVEWF